MIFFMGINEEIQREYIKMKNDRVVDETTTINSKKQFADMILNGNIGNELNNCNNYVIQSRPLKIPFRIRMRNFINKLKYVLWN